jgi:hypothetical protein
MAANSKSSRSAGCLPRRSNIRLALLLFLTTAVPPLWAQEPSVSMKIDLVAWGDDISGLSLKPGGAKGTITALSFRYSVPVAYSGPAIMEIHKTGGEGVSRAPEPSADDQAHQLMPLLEAPPGAASADPAKPKQGLALELDKRREKAPTLVALAALPASGCRRATVLLAPADGGTFIAYVIDDDPSKLPLGQLRLHNLSPLPIAVRCNGKLNQELKTRESFVVPAENQQLIYELAYKLGDEWKMQENNVIPVRETEQTQMIVLKSTNSYFLSTDGSGGGYLQVVTLRRKASAP